MRFSTLETLEVTCTDFEDAFPTKVCKLPNTHNNITILITHSCWCPSTERNPCWYTPYKHISFPHISSQNTHKIKGNEFLCSLLLHMCSTLHTHYLCIHTLLTRPIHLSKQLVDGCLLLLLSSFPYLPHLLLLLFALPIAINLINATQMQKCYVLFLCVCVCVSLSLSLPQDLSLSLSLPQDLSLSLSLSLSRPISVSLSLTHREFPRDHGHGPKCGTHEHVGKSVATRSWSLG